MNELSNRLQDVLHGKRVEMNVLLVQMTEKFQNDVENIKRMTAEIDAIQKQLIDMTEDESWEGA